MTNKPRTHAGDLESIKQSPAFAHLVGEPRWVTWQWLYRPGKNGNAGKWTKPPLQAHGLDYAKSDDPATWGTFDFCLDSVRHGRADGIGIMLHGADIAAIDVDKCRDATTGEVAGWATSLLAKVPGAYCEVTVSGTGLRIIGRSSGAPVHRKLVSSGCYVEIYRNCHRYITVSHFQAVATANLANIDGFIDDLLARYDSPPVETPQPEGNAGNGHIVVDGSGPIDLNLAGPQVEGNASLDHEDLLENGVPEGGRSEAFNAFVWSCASRGFTLEEIIQQLERNPDGIAQKYLDQGGSRRLIKEATRCYEKWARARVVVPPGVTPPPPPPGATASAGPAPGPAPRTFHQHRIIVAAGEKTRITNEAEDALLDLGREIYQRGPDIVRPTLQKLKAADGGITEAWRLKPVTAAFLTETFECAAQFVKLVGNGAQRIQGCPSWVAQTYLDRCGHWRLPYLTGIITSPILRADGSILEVPGYDERTGLIYKPDIVFPAIPARPSREDALRALAFLKDAIATFPFVSDADRSVGLSGFLTAQHKRSLVTAPLHGFSAQSRTGKSKFVDGIGIMVTGRKVAVAAPSGEDEFYKHLGAMLRTGADIISLDNWDRPLESALLCQILTQDAIDYRVFVINTIERIPTGAMVFGTGVNFTLKGDLRGRSVRAKMDAGMDAPQTRKFSNDFTSMVMEDRGRFVLAALTILRAWFVAKAQGEFVDIDPFGGFEGWSSSVREALVWLGEADPCLTVEQISADDPERAVLLAVITQWEECLGASSLSGGRSYTSAELIAEAEHVRFQVSGNGVGFYNALAEAAGIGAKLNSKMLTTWLNLKAKDTVVNNRKIVRGAERAGSVTWKLVRV
jgi:hypothetical protein